MIRHIVWWTLKKEALGKSESENIKYLLEAAKSLKNIPSALSVEISANIAETTNVPCQLVLSTTHESLEKLEEYQRDPVHVKFAEALKARVDSRKCIDFVF